MGNLALAAVLAAISWNTLTGPALAAADKIVIAHRGASGYLPEHTLEAKAMAYAMGADFLEQDIVLTRDDVPIVLHDIHLDTVTDVAEQFPDRRRADGRYYAIDFTLAEIQRLKVHERIDLKTGKPVFEHRFPVGRSHFTVPTLAEEIELIQGLNQSTGRNVGIYPELKAPAWHRAEGKDLAHIVLNTVNAYGYRTRSDRIYLQCFDFDTLRRLRRDLGTDIKLVHLISENSWNEAPTDFDHPRTPEGIRSIAEVVNGIGPTIGHIITDIDADSRPITTDLVKLAHSAGLEVHPYTFRADALPAWAPSLDDLLRLFFGEVGVDGVFTDFPDRTVGFLRRNSR
jgi:glycerophosphoryl diester phosphodiesterase